MIEDSIIFLPESIKNIQLDGKIADSRVSSSPHPLILDPAIPTLKSTTNSISTEKNNKTNNPLKK